MAAIEEFQALPISGSWKMAEAIVTRQQAEIDDLRRQLAEVKQERDTLNEVCQSVRETFGYDMEGPVDLATDVGVDCYQMKQDLTQAREQLAIAAAFVEACSNRVSYGGTYDDVRGDYDIHVAFYDRREAMVARDKLEQLLKGNTGRDMLAEMKAKDERIAELERECAGLADKAYNEADPVEMTDAEIDNLVANVTQEPKPVEWQYRGLAGTTIRYRSCDLVNVCFRRHDGSWEKSYDYKSWQALCDNELSYPCDEHGERIEDHIADTGKMVTTYAGQQSEIAELRQKLAAQAELVKIAEELRELLQGTAIRNTGSEGVDLTVIDGKSIASTFIKLRDMKGGA